jgi:hypothetical protein
VHTARHGGGSHDSPERRAEREKEELNRKVDDATRQAVISATVKRFDWEKPQSTEDLRMLALLSFQKFGNSESRKLMSKVRTGTEEGYLQEEKSPLRVWIARAHLDELFRFIFEGLLRDLRPDWDPEEGEEDELFLSAKRWGLDVQQIRSAIEADFYAKRKEAEARAAERVAAKDRKTVRQAAKAAEAEEANEERALAAK